MNFTNNTYGVHHDHEMYAYSGSPTIKQPVHMVVIYSIAYGLVFLFAFFGNILVVTVVCKNPVMHNVTNYFLANLAISDILVAIVCIPITLLANLFKGTYCFLT